MDSLSSSWRHRLISGLVDAPRLRFVRERPRRPVAAVAALAPVCWLAPAPGASSPESALGVDPRLLQNEPEDLDTRDSGGENKPTLWAAPILVLF